MFNFAATCSDLKAVCEHSGDKWLQVATKWLPKQVATSDCYCLDNIISPHSEKETRISSMLFREYLSSKGRY